MAKITIIVQNTDEKAIQDAGILILDENQNLLETIHTNEKGQADISLQENKIYYIKQNKTLKEYKNAKIKKIVLTEDTTILLENKRKHLWIILIFFFLILAILLLFLWKQPSKPTITLGEKEENNNQVTENNTVENTITNNTTTNNKETHNTTITVIPNDKTNTTETPNSPTEEPQEPEKPVEIVKEFTVTENQKKWNEELGIFNNTLYNNKPVIYPGLASSYYFEVKNTLDNTISYQLKFTEENEEQLPILYKLKKDNQYIVGDKNTYVPYSDLMVSNTLIGHNEVHNYELEWKWIESNNDNKYGDTIKNIIYQLLIEVTAEEK